MPAPHTLLAALPALALDLETTGLDVRRDRVVQAAAVALLGERILDEPRLDLLVDPGVPVPEVAKRIHGLGSRELAGAPPFACVAGELFAAFEGRVILGHHVGFDLAVLRHEAARAGIAWREPASLDVALLAAALEPSLRDHGLETIARLLGVPLEGRHSAIGDALIAARVFARLLPRLRQADVRTLAEAQALAARRADLLREEAAAGWAAPGATAAPGVGGRRERLDCYIFERRLGEVMSAPPVRIAPEATLRQAARLMSERRIGALLVGRPGGAPEGILTERDVLRASAGAGELETLRVDAVMSAPVQAMAADEMLYRALGRMDRAGIRHLCVVDGDGAAIGMVSQRDLLRHRARRALALGDAVAAAGDAASLAAAYERLPAVAAALVEEGLDGAEVGQVISSELRAATARATEIAAAGLAAGGEPAPAPWCVLVLGSGGRGESLLGADQDNALVHEGTAADDAWFARLGEATSELLDQAGIPRCRGGVMAANPAWRGTPEQWRQRVSEWLARARPEDLLNVDIFFDLQPVAGEMRLGRALHQEALDAAMRHPPFLALLAQSVSRLRPALGPLGGLRARDGRIDLKLGGLLPLVGLARVLALRIGSPARTTRERLRAAAAAGRIAESDADALADVHASLATLILRQQLADLAQGVRPSGRVARAGLSRAEAQRLRADLRRLDALLLEAQPAVSR